MWSLGFSLKRMAILLTCTTFQNENGYILLCTLAVESNDCIKPVPFLSQQWGYIQKTTTLCSTLWLLKICSVRKDRKPFHMAIVVKGSHNVVQYSCLELLSLFLIWLKVSYVVSCCPCIFCSRGCSSSMSFLISIGMSHLADDFEEFHLCMHLIMLFLRSV